MRYAIAVVKGLLFFLQVRAVSSIQLFIQYCGPEKGFATIASSVLIIILNYDEKELLIFSADLLSSYFAIVCINFKLGIKLVVEKCNTRYKNLRKN